MRVSGGLASSSAGGEYTEAGYGGGPGRRRARAGAEREWCGAEQGSKRHRSPQGGAMQKAVGAEMNTAARGERAVPEVTSVPRRGPRASTSHSDTLLSCVRAAPHHRAFFTSLGNSHLIVSVSNRFASTFRRSVFGCVYTVTDNLAIIA